jgi:hypothetical protein
LWLSVAPEKLAKRCYPISHEAEPEPKQATIRVAALSACIFC